jgi:hypothetical protein
MPGVFAAVFYLALFPALRPLHPSVAALGCAAGGMAWALTLAMPTTSTGAPVLVYLSDRCAATVDPGERAVLVAAAEGLIWIRAVVGDHGRDLRRDWVRAAAIPACVKAQSRPATYQADQSQAGSSRRRARAPLTDAVGRRLFQLGRRPSSSGRGRGAVPNEQTGPRSGHAVGQEARERSARMRRTTAIGAPASQQ